MTDVMTDKQFDKIIKMIRMVLDGCDNLDDAKGKIDQLLEEQGPTRKSQKDQQNEPGRQ